MPSKEQVNHPVHYTSHPSGVECIQITEHYNFNIGNVIKYVWRAGLKNDEFEDLRKARWYLDREIARRTGGTPVSDNCVASNQPEIGHPVTEPMPKGKRAEVSAGSEPVAWAVVYPGSNEIEGTFTDREDAEEWAELDEQVVPLYRHPQPVVAENATTTLTDAERHALRDAAESFEYDDDDPDCARVAVILRGLLERAGGGE